MGTEILRPNATGAETNLDLVYNPGNWDAVDEVTPDESYSYVKSTVIYAQWNRDLYNIFASGVGAGTIDFIEVYARCKATAEVPDCPSLKIAIKSGTGTGPPDTIDESSEIMLTNSWVNYSNQWNTNPATGVAWTWDEIDKLQIGIVMRVPHNTLARFSWCTQVWVEVVYGWAGKVMGVTNPAKVMGIAKANIAKVKGVA